jgi:hypothetical protein
VLVHVELGRVSGHEQEANEEEDQPDCHGQEEQHEERPEAHAEEPREAEAHALDVGN